MENGSEPRTDRGLRDNKDFLRVELLVVPVAILIVASLLLLFGPFSVR